MEISRCVVTHEKPTEKLKNIQDGTVFRFVENAFDSALEDNVFYMKLQSQSVPAGRVEIVNVFDGLKLLRDEDRRVVKHYTDLQITE